MANPKGKAVRPNTVESDYQAAVTQVENQRQQEKKNADAVRKVASLQGQVDSLMKSETSSLRNIKDGEALLAIYKKQLDIKEYNSTHPGPPTEFQILDINTYNTMFVKPIQKQISDEKTNYANTVTKREAVQKQLLAAYNVGSSATVAAAIASGSTTKARSSKKPTAGNSGNNPITSAAFAPPEYTYNAPMVRTAYLNPGLGITNSSPQQETSSRTISDPGRSSALLNDALTAWDGTLGVKGVIQMDRTTKFNLANVSSTNSKKIDGKLYGFKFLYNPKEVAMHWGMTDSLYNPEAVASTNTGAGFTLSLQNGTISFSLLLNRMGDQAWLDSNGFNSGDTGKRIEDIYPYFVDDAELKEVYKNGTMYDLEYLFKTISGTSGTFVNPFDQLTADRGWLQGIQVELHLGKGLRYQVRVNSLDVNHVIFNENMVPILSEVNISCSRFLNVKQP